MVDLLAGDPGPFYQAVAVGNMVALDLMENHLRRLRPPNLGTVRLLDTIFSLSHGFGNDTEVGVLDITCVRIIRARMEPRPIRAIRPRTYFDALETYTYLRERGGTLFVENRGFPLEYG